MTAGHNLEGSALPRPPPTTDQVTHWSPFAQTGREGAYYAHRK